MHRNAKRPPFLVLIFNLAICVDTKIFLTKKKLLRLITGTNILIKNSYHNKIYKTSARFYFNTYLKYFSVYDSETLTNYIVGDERVSENPALGGMHVIWVRQHNHIAQRLAKITSWSSYKIFQEARKIIGAMLQFITYKHYLPKILSPKTLARQVSFNA